jgi:hypothetical protein
MQHFLAAGEFRGGRDILFEEFEHLGRDRLPARLGAGAKRLVDVVADVLDIKCGHG